MYQLKSLNMHFFTYLFINNYLNNGVFLFSYLLNTSIFPINYRTHYQLEIYSWRLICALVSRKSEWCVRMYTRNTTMYCDRKNIVQKMVTQILQCKYPFSPNRFAPTLSHAQNIRNRAVTML